MDGSSPHIAETGSFNAFGVDINCKGKNVHPGYAYDVMMHDAPRRFFFYKPASDTIVWLYRELKRQPLHNACYREAIAQQTP